MAGIRRPHPMAAATGPSPSRRSGPRTPDRRDGRSRTSGRRSAAELGLVAGSPGARRPGIRIGGVPSPGRRRLPGRHCAGGDGAPVALVGQRRPEPDGHACGRDASGAPRGLHGPGTDDAHRDDRHVAAEGQPGHPGVALVQAGVGGPGPLGIDGQQAAAVEHPDGRVEGPLRGVAAARGSSGSARRPGRTTPSPVVEVLGLGHVGHPAAEHEGQEERVAERLVVGGQDGRDRGRGCARALRPSPATAGRRPGSTPP